MTELDEVPQTRGYEIRKAAALELKCPRCEARPGSSCFFKQQCMPHDERMQAGDAASPEAEMLRRLLQTQGIEGVLCQIAREMHARGTYVVPGSELARFQAIFSPIIAETLGITNE